MRLKSKNTSFWLAGTALMLAALPAQADMPGKHPYYLHALSDLRTARWMLEHRAGDAAVSAQEDVAIQQVDAAIDTIKRAAIDDGKNLRDHPAMDVPGDHPGRLHKAAELLRKVRSDLAREEDDPTARSLKHQSLEHVEAALDATKHALFDAEHHR